MVKSRPRHLRDAPLFFLHLEAEVPCRITASSKTGEHGASTNPGDICEWKQTHNQGVPQSYERSRSGQGRTR